MITVNTHEAKADLDRLLAAVEERNEVVVICRDGKPVAQIIAPKPAVDRLTPDPSLRVTLHYNPVEPLQADEVPPEYR